MDHCSACRHRHRRQLEVERPHRRCRHSRKQEAAAAMRLQVARPCHKMRKVSAQLVLSQRFVDQLPGLECHLSLITVIITFIAAFLHKHLHTGTTIGHTQVCCIIWIPLFPLTFRNSPRFFGGAAVVRDNFSTAQKHFHYIIIFNGIHELPHLQRLLLLLQSSQIFVSRFASGCIIADVVPKRKHSPCGS